MTKYVNEFDLDDMNITELQSLKEEIEQLIVKKEAPHYKAGDVLMYEDDWSIKLYKMKNYEEVWDDMVYNFEYIKLGKNASNSIYKGSIKLTIYEIIDSDLKSVDPKLWDKAEELYPIYCIKFDEVNLNFMNKLEEISNEMITKFKESMI